LCAPTFHVRGMKHAVAMESTLSGRGVLTWTRSDQCQILVINACYVTATACGDIMTSALALNASSVVYVYCIQNVCAADVNSHLPGSDVIIGFLLDEGPLHAIHPTELRSAVVWLRSTCITCLSLLVAFMFTWSPYTSWTDYRLISEVPRQLYHATIILCWNRAGLTWGVDAYGVQWWLAVLRLQF
jgi:hypothetical protein